jgi:hypothetical protein
MDETKNPPSLVLQQLDDDLLHASSEKSLERSELKLVAKKVLQAIEALHKDGYTHTGKFRNFTPMFNFWTGPKDMLTSRL